MFIGHWAPALAVGASRKSPGLGTLFIAAQLVDWAFFGFLLLGWEKMRLTPGISAMNPMDLYHMPYTHSLVGSLAFALGFTALIWFLTRDRTAGLVAGSVVFSHWVASAVQSSYRVELNVIATDANFESGPKVGQNLEPIRLLIVSEEDLLAEISRDEETLINKLDDTIKKLKAAQAKLFDLSDRLSSATSSNDLLASASVKATDIAQDIGKARDQAVTIHAEYKRLYREAETNRCNNRVLDRLMTSVLAPLDGANQKQFPEAEDAHKAVAEELAGNRKPVPIAIQNDRNALAALIKVLDDIRSSLGDALTISKAQEELRKIISRQEMIRKTTLEIKKLNIEKLFAPSLKSPGILTIEKGKSQTVKVAIDWKFYDKDDWKLSFEGVDGISVPKELIVKSDKDEFELPIKAGDKPGDYRVTVTPSVGLPLVIVVQVK